MIQYFAEILSGKRHFQNSNTFIGGLIKKYGIQFSGDRKKMAG